MAFEPDKRSGDYLFWVDTGASLLRLGAGLAIAAAIGLVLGIGIGLIPLFGATLAAVRGRGLDGAAAGDPADPVHRPGPGRDAKITLITLGIAPIWSATSPSGSASCPRSC